MEKIELRPLSLGELLDRTFALYRSHFWLFCWDYGDSLLLFDPAECIRADGAGSLVPRTPPSPRLIGGLLIGYFVFAIVFLVVYGIAIGAATYAVSDSYLGRETTVRGSYGKVRGNIWRIVGLILNIWLRLIGLMLLFVLVAVALSVGIAFVARGLAPNLQSSPVLIIVLGIGAFLLYVAALVFFFIFMLRYAVAIPALLLEQLKITAAIHRSTQLTKGRRGQIFVACLLSAIIAYIGVLVFQGPFLVAISFRKQGAHGTLADVLDVCMRRDRRSAHRPVAYDRAGALLLRFAHSERGIRSAIYDGVARAASNARRSFPSVR